MNKKALAAALPVLRNEAQRASTRGPTAPSIGSLKARQRAQRIGGDEAVKRIPLLALTLLAGCGNDPNVIAYVCEEPLQGYLDRAHTNISNDYEIERSREVLATCPEKGFHRRYTFKFMKSALASKQSADAEITAIWCNDPVERVVQAELDVAPSILTFRFTYPWSTETGKYPRTEFRLHTSTLRGGFAKDLDWRCRLEQASAPPA